MKIWKKKSDSFLEETNNQQLSKYISLTFNREITIFVENFRYSTIKTIITNTKLRTIRVLMVQ